MIRALSLGMLAVLVAHAAEIEIVDTGARDYANLYIARLDSAGNAYMGGNCRAVGVTENFGTDNCLRKVASDGTVVYTAGLAVDRINAFDANSAGEAYVYGFSSTAGATLQKLDGSGRSLYRRTAPISPLAACAFRGGGVIGASACSGDIKQTPGTLPKPDTEGPLDLRAIAVQSADDGSDPIMSWLAPTFSRATQIVQKPDGSYLFFGGSTHYAYTSDVPVQRLLMTTNGGTEWTLQSEIASPSNNTRAPKPAIDPANPDVLYAAGGDFVYRSNDRGASWETIATIPDANLHAISIHPRNSSVLCATGGAWRLGSFARDYAVYRSEDAGQSWVRIASQSGLSPAFATDPQDSNRIYLAQLRTLSVSADAGVNWKVVGQFQTNITEIAVDPTDSSRVYVSAYDSLYRSLDGGATFSNAGRARNLRSIQFDPAHPDRVYAIQTDFLSFSDDMGATWSRPLTDEFGYYTRISDAQVVNGTAYATSSSRLLKSEDSGYSWTALPDPGVGSTISGFTVAPTNAAHVYATADRAEDIAIAVIDQDFSKTQWTVQFGTFGFDSIRDTSACESSATFVGQSTGASFLGILNTNTGELRRWDFPVPDGYKGVLASAYENCGTGERIMAARLTPDGAAQTSSITLIAKLSTEMEYTELGRIPTSEPKMVRPGSGNKAHVLVSSYEHYDKANPIIPILIAKVPTAPERE